MKMLSKIKDYFVKPEPPAIWVAFEQLRHDVNQLHHHISDLDDEFRHMVKMKNDLHEKLNQVYDEIVQLKPSLKAKKDTKPEKPKPKKPRKAKE